MAQPTSTRSTAGFRSLELYELSSGSVVGLPLGAKTLEPYTPFAAAGSTPTSAAGSLVAAGTAVTGGVGYYGVIVSGTKVLTINDPAPRSIPHTGNDTLLGVQILPSLEPINGELRLDKTSDVVDAVIGNIKAVVVGETNILGMGTSQRGYENQVGALAYAAAQDTDLTSTTYGSVLWDFRIFPKSFVFARDPGYAQEANERVYTFQPVPTTAHLWGVQFTKAVEGYVRAQMLRGVSQFKPVICGFLGDGSVQAFPFDSARPAASVAKIVVWVDGVLKSSGVTKTLYGLAFTTAPTLGAIVTVFYEE